MKRLALLLAVLCCLMAACSAKPSNVEPLPCAMDLNNLGNCTISGSLKQGDAYVDDTGAMQMKITVFFYDEYNKEHIDQLKVKDFITIRGQRVSVAALERNQYGAVHINGGMDGDGYTLFTDGKVYFEVGFNDAKCWQELGTATIRVSQDLIFTDRSNPDLGTVTYYPGDFLIPNGGIEYNFNPYNTVFSIQGGLLTAIDRFYIP